jgi:hypothetical protein
MKTFQKIILASAISAAPFMAQAELTPMDDSLMGDTTGQAGVTIDLTIGSTGVKVGAITYTDEGSVKINDISITGVDGNGVAQDVTIKQEIDVIADGSLQIKASTTPGQLMQVGVGSIQLVGQMVDTGDAAADLLTNTATSNASSELVNNLDITLELGSNSTTTIHNVNMTDVSVDTNGHKMNTLGHYGVTGTYADKVSGLVIEQSSELRITDMNVGLFGYTAAQSQVVAGGISAGVAAGTLNDVNRANNAITAVNDANGLSAGDAGFVAAAVSGTALDATQTATVAGAAAAGSAVSITGLTFDDGAGGLVTMDQTIWAQGGHSSTGGGVYIQMGKIEGTLSIDAINIGGASIGSVTVADIDLAGVTQRIYGH